MPHSTPGVPVKYTGTESPFVDRNYNSGLTFQPQQSRTIPSEIAEKLLRHVDVFTQGDALQAAAPQTDSDLDDTAAQIEAAAQKRLTEDKALSSLQNMIDQINVMDKDALRDFAQIKYGQAVPKTLSVENMRAKVTGLVDQFGVV